MTPKNRKSKTTTAARESNEEKYVLRLYVTGATSRSRCAILNINAICARHLEGKYSLEIVDILQKPALAREAQIVAAPTLIKLLPLPLRRIIGDLSDTEKVLAGLGVKCEAQV